MEDKYHLGVKALVKNKKKQILLLKINPEKNIKNEDWNGEPFWDIPGGRVKKGSTVEETLKIEITEETGIKYLTKIEPISMVLSNIRVPIENEEVGLILSIYSCEIDEKETIKLSDEHTEFAWVFPIEAAEKLKFKYPKEFTDIVAAL